MLTSIHFDVTATYHKIIKKKKNCVIVMSLPPPKKKKSNPNALNRHSDVIFIFVGLNEVLFGGRAQLAA